VVRPFPLKIEVACRLAGRKVHDKAEGMGLWPSRHDVCRLIA